MAPAASAAAQRLSGLPIRHNAAEPLVRQRSAKISHIRQTSRVPLELRLGLL
jgi:hypothetical protein